IDRAPVGRLLLEELLLVCLDEEVRDVEHPGLEFLPEEREQVGHPLRLAGVLASQVLGEVIDEPHLRRQEPRGRKPTDEAAAGVGAKEEVGLDVGRGMSAAAATWAAPLRSPTMWPPMATVHADEPAPESAERPREAPAESAPDAGSGFAAAAADPDVALMLRCQSGEEAAFQDLFRKFSPRVLQFARRFVGSEARAEEVTQDVFVQVFRFRHRYRPQSRFSTWLYTIATNLCLNEVR